jgi:hypothetical protein
LKRILFLSLLFILCAFQCEDEVEDNRRSVVSGLIVDGSNNPVSDIKIQVISENNILGESRSNSGGAFSFTSLRPAYGNFRIAVNTVEGSPYGPVNFVYGDSSFEELYDLSAVTVRKTSVLDLRINKTTPGADQLDFTLEYISSDCTFYFINTNMPNTEECFEEILLSETLSGAQSNYETELSSLLNTTVRFTYELNNEPPQTILIDLTDATTTYEFEY